MVGPPTDAGDGGARSGRRLQTDPTEVFVRPRQPPFFRSRGAISGALKKKLGPTVEAARICEVGPNKTGAGGSSTVDWVTGAGPAAS